MLKTFSAPQSDAFQSDLFPAALSNKAALTADQWVSGKSAQPIVVNLETGAQTTAGPVSTKAYASIPTLSPAPRATPTASAPAPTPAPATTPALAAVVKSVEEPAPTPAPVFTPTPVISRAPSPQTPAASNGASKSDEEVLSLRQENKRLRDELAERDTLVRELELKLEKVKVSLSLGTY